jgi:sugar lactone lactonase YvrE
MVRSVPVWSPDSQKVAFVEGPHNTLVEVEVDTQTRHEITHGASVPRYRPDGSGIGCVVEDVNLVWLGNDYNAFQTILSAETLPSNVSIKDFEWLPDRQYVVYALVDNREHLLLDPQFERSVWITQIDDPDPTKLIDNAREVSVSPDGRTVVVLQGSGFGDGCFEDTGLVFLLSARDFTQSRHVDVESFDGYPLLESPNSLAFHPRSNVIWVSDGLAIAQFHAWCGYASNVVGRYLIDPIGERMVQITRNE